MSTLLGIDYGLARIGLAVARFGLAEPLLVLQNDHHDGLNPKVLAQLLAIIEREKIDTIVVGVSEAIMAEKTLDFVEFLKSKTAVPIELVDETLSSYEVMLKLKDLPKKNRRGPIDHYAAALILENYLDLC